MLWRIEVQLGIAQRKPNKVVYERATIRPEPCAVAHNALGVVTDVQSHKKGAEKLEIRFRTVQQRIVKER